MCTSHAPENVVVCDVALADVRRLAGSLPGVTGLPLRLRAQAVLLAWPAAAAVTWTLLLLRSDTGRPVGAGAAPDGAAASAAPDGAAPGRDDPGPGPVSSG